MAAPVTSVVPELAGTSFDGATVQQLLDMRTGTRFDETYEDPKADVRLYEQVYLWRPRDGRKLPADAIAYFKTLRNDGTHGGPFRYRSILTDVLGWVVERAAGARLADLISRELWQPMGAEFDAEVTVDGHGNAMADGGICATLRDLARFGQLFLQWGRRGRQQVVPRAWIEDTIRGAPDGAKAFADGDPEGWYPEEHPLPEQVVGLRPVGALLLRRGHPRAERLRAPAVADGGGEALDVAGRVEAEPEAPHRHGRAGDRARNWASDPARPMSGNSTDPSHDDRRRRVARP